MPVTEENALELLGMLNSGGLSPEDQLDAFDYVQKYEAGERKAGRPIYANRNRQLAEEDQRLHRAFTRPDYGLEPDEFKAFQEINQKSADPFSGEAHFNKQFVSDQTGIPLDEVDSRWGLIRDQFARERYGTGNLNIPDDGAFRKLVAQEYAERDTLDENASIAAIRELTPTEGFNQFQAATGSDMSRNRARYDRQYANTARTYAPYKSIMRDGARMLRDLTNAEGGEAIKGGPTGPRKYGHKTEDLDSFVDRFLATVPKEDQDQVLAAIGVLSETETGDKSGLIKFAESFGRPSESIWRGFGVSRQVKKAATTDEIRQRLQPAKEAIGDTYQFMPGAGYLQEFLDKDSDLTPEMIERWDLIESMHSIGRTQTDAAEGEHWYSKIAYGIGSSLPHMALLINPATMAMSAYANTGEHFLELGQRYPDMTTEMRRQISENTGPAATISQIFTRQMLFGKIPHVEKAIQRVLSPVATTAGQQAGRGALRFIAGAGGEYVQEFTENYIPPVYQELKGAFEKDVPEVKWDEYHPFFSKDNTITLFGIVGAMSIFGVGKATFNDFKNTDLIFSNARLIRASALGKFSEAEAMEISSLYRAGSKKEAGEKYQALYQKTQGNKPATPEVMENLIADINDHSERVARAASQLEGVRTPRYRNLGGKHSLQFPEDGSVIEYETKEAAIQDYSQFLQERITGDRESFRDMITDRIGRLSEDTTDQGVLLPSEAYSANLRDTLEAAGASEDVLAEIDRAMPEREKLGYLDKEQGTTPKDGAPSEHDPTVQPSTGESQKRTSREILQEEVSNARAEVEFQSADSMDADMGLRYLGLNTLEEGEVDGYSKKVYDRTWYLFEGANALTFLEESLELDATEIMNREGIAPLVARLRDVERVTGMKLFDAADDALNPLAVREAYSHFQMSNLIGKDVSANPMFTDKEFRDHITKVANSAMAGTVAGSTAFFKAVFERRDMIQAAKDAGADFAELESLLARSLDLEEQFAEQDRTREEAKAMARDIQVGMSQLFPTVYEESKKPMRNVMPDLRGWDGGGMGNGWNAERGMSNNAASAIDNGRLPQSDFRGWVEERVGKITNEAMSHADAEAQNIFKEYHHIGNKVVDFYDLDAIETSPSWWLGIHHFYKDRPRGKSVARKAKAEALKAWKALKQSMLNEGRLHSGKGEGIAEASQSTPRKPSGLDSLDLGIQSKVKSGQMSFEEGVKADTALRETREKETFEKRKKELSLRVEKTLKRLSDATVDNFPLRGGKTLPDVKRGIARLEKELAGGKSKPAAWKKKREETLKSLKDSVKNAPETFAAYQRDLQSRLKRHEHDFRKLHDDADVEITDRLFQAQRANQDAAYLAAVESGDVETQQAMVDEAARAAGVPILVGGIKWDNRGIGSVPNQVDLSYFGFTYPMTPAEFRKLVPPGVSGPDTKAFIKKKIFSAEPIAPPWVSAKWDEAESVWKIRDHEGRSRTDAAGEIAPKVPMPVGILPDNKRAESITPEMMVAPIIPQGGGAPITPAPLINAPVTYDASGNVIPLSERFDSGRPEIGFSAISPEQDSAYLAAVESGDVETQQRLVYAAGELNGFTKSHRRSDGKTPGETGYVTQFYDPSSTIGGRETGNRGYGDSEFLIRDSALYKEPPQELVDLAIQYLSEDTGFPGSWYAVNEIEGKEAQEEAAIRQLLPDDIVDAAGLWDDPEFVGLVFEELEWKFEQDGMVGIETPDGAIAVLTDDYRQIKSADPVTYDAGGNVIPLSERFDSGKDSILFQQSPESTRHSELEAKHNEDTITEAEIAEAQALVDARANAAGYGLELFRGQPEGTTVLEGTDDMGDFNARVIFATSKPRVAKTYNRNVERIRVKEGDFLERRGMSASKAKFGFADAINEALAAGKDGVIFRNVRDLPSSVKGELEDLLPSRNLERFNSDVYAIFDSSAVKSADPFTYDAGGNVIPLSERFDSGRPEIGFSALAGDIDAELAAMFSPFQRDPDLRRRLGIELLDRTSLEGRRWEMLLAKHDEGDVSKAGYKWWEDQKTLEDLQASMRMLNVVVSALPKEIRHAVGGYIQLTQRKTPQGKLAEIGRRVKKIDKLLEKHLQKELIEDFNTLLKNAQPKADAGKSPSGKITAAGHKWFGRVEDAAIKGGADVDKRMTEIEALMMMPDTTEEDLDELIEEYSILQSYGDFYHRSASELSDGLEMAQSVFKQGRDEWKAVLEDRRARFASFREDAFSDLGNRGTLEEQSKLGLERYKKPRRTTASGVLTITDTLENTLRGVLGEKSKLADRWVAESRRATNRERDAIIREEDEWNAFVHTVVPGDTRRKRKMRLWAMLQPTNKISLAGKVSVKSEKLDIETANRLIANPKQAEALGLSPEQYTWLENELAANEKRGRHKKRKIVVEVIKHDERVSFKVSEMEMAHILMTSAQEGYLDALEKHGIDSEALLEMGKALSQEGYAMKRYMGDKYREGWEELNRIYTRIHGINLPKIKNYAPGLWEHQGDLREMAVDGPHMQNGGAKAAFTRGRKNHKARINLDFSERTINATSIFWNHVAQTEHWKAWAELTNEMKAVLNNVDIKAAIEAAHGKQALKAISQRLEIAENGGLQSGRDNTFLTKTMNHLMQAKARTALGLKLSVYMVQGTASIHSLLDLPLKAGLKAYGRVLSGQSKMGLKEALKNPVIQRRLKSGFSPEVRMAKGGDLFRKPTVANEFLDWSMETIGEADARFTVFSAAAAYDAHYAIATGPDMNMSEADAREYADLEMNQVIGRTAQPVESMDRSLLELSNNIFARMMLMFKSEARQKIGLELSLARQWDWGKGEKGTGAKLARTVFVNHAILGTYVWLLRGMARDLLNGNDDEGDDDPAWEVEDWILSMALGPFSGLPILGDAVEFTMATLMRERTWNDSDNPLISPIQDIGMSGYKMAKALHDPPTDDEFAFWVKNLAKFTRGVGMVVGGDAAAAGVTASVLEQAFRIVDNFTDD